VLDIVATMRYTIDAVATSYMLHLKGGIKMLITSTTTLQELFDHACSSVNEVLPDEKFLVKDLFKGIEWNRIPKGFRTKLGSMFLNYIKGEASTRFEILNKTPQNQQIYRNR